MNSLKRLSIAFFIGLLFFSCKTNINLTKPTTGGVNFYNYVAIGNSLTAGYEDGGLYQEGQLNSYPNIIATQLQGLGSAGFYQPLFGPGQENGSGYLKLTGFTSAGLPILANVTTDLAIVGTAVNGVTHQTQYLYAPNTASKISNLGIPGIRLSDILTPGYGSPAGNPYFQRLLSSSEYLKTYQQKVLETNPTFFSCWLGDNDVLSYATSGGTVPLTPTATFQALYAQLITALMANGAKGVVSTIPDVTLIPFLNTQTVAKISAAAGGATVYITTSTGLVRAATSADLVNLTTTGIGVPNGLGAPKGYSPYNPLLNSEVLDADEVNSARAAVVQYNNIIGQIATANGLAISDINILLNKYKNGAVTDGIPLNLNYISGGIFSLDGVHLTPRGYAIVANSFISSINATYGSSIPTVNIGNYRGVKFPN